MDQIDFLKKYIKNDKRLIHSYSVAEHMKEHAAYFGIDAEEAYTAGIFHDIAKEFSDETLIELSENFIARNIFKINYFPFKKKMPFLLHGTAGAEILLKEYGLENKNILEAIIHHTTGGEKISLLAKYTFIFDYCEPLREDPDSVKIYHLLVKQKCFDEAYFMTYKSMLKYFISKKILICLESINGYNEALELLANK